MSEMKKMSATCPICKDAIDVDVQVEMVEKASSYPVSVLV